MKYEYLLFDMDGTLLNTLDDIADSLNATMRHMGYAEHPTQRVMSFINNGVRRLVMAALPQGATDEVIEEALSDFTERYRQNVANKTKPYPGIIELLGELKSRGFKMAVVSNKFDSAVKMLSDKFFAGLIDVAIGENEKGGMRKKPYPDVAFEALKQLGAQKELSLYVGDSDVDVETAKNAGLDFLGVSWGFRSRENLELAGAAFIADSPGEVIDVMERM